MNLIGRDNVGALATTARRAGPAGSRAFASKIDPVGRFCQLLTPPSPPEQTPPPPGGGGWGGGRILRRVAPPPSPLPGGEGE